MEFTQIKNSELKALQTTKFLNQIEYIKNNSKGYQKKWANIDLSKIKSIEDIKKFPITKKSELPTSLDSEIVSSHLWAEVHETSGSTGESIIAPYTFNDLNTWATLTARCLTQIGVTSNDRVQNMFGYGMFTGGLSIHYGTKRIGAMIIPKSTGGSEKQILDMMKYKTTVVCGTSSYLIGALYEKLIKMQYNKEALFLKKVLCSAEIMSDESRQLIEDRWGVDVYNLYGLSEFVGPVAMDCQEKNGMHVFSDYTYAEILDQKTQEPVKDGEEGILVLTSLQSEAMPLVRYWTNDIAYMDSSPCKCGSVHPRIWIKGRADDMLIISGVNIYPIQIDIAIKTLIMNSVPITTDFYIAIDKNRLKSNFSLKKLEIIIGVKENADINDYKDLIYHRIHSSTKTTTSIRFVPEKVFEKTGSKENVIVDINSDKYKQILSLSF